MNALCNRVSYKWLLKRRGKKRTTRSGMSTSQKALCYTTVFGYWTSIWRYEIYRCSGISNTGQNISSNTWGHWKKTTVINWLVIKMENYIILLSIQSWTPLFVMAHHDDRITTEELWTIFTVHGAIKLMQVFLHSTF